MYVADPSIAALTEALRVHSGPPEETVLILLAERSAPDLDGLPRALAQTGRSFVGALFPGLFTPHGAVSTGALLLGLPARSVSWVQDLSTAPITAPSAPSDEEWTAMVWVDGLSSKVTELLSELYRELGDTVRFFGGGAGSLTLQQRPCLFDADGARQDAAVVLWLKQSVGLGIQHGWEHLHGPLLATRTRGNAVLELNWRPAYAVYKEIVDQHQPEALTIEGFFDIAKSFPLGMYNQGTEAVVRDPIAVGDDGETLLCVGEIPENAPLSVLSGTPTALVNAASQAMKQAVAAAPATSIVVVVDCISRKLFLRERFTEEHATLVAQAPVPPYGALTLGEISSVGSSYLEFFNKTCVVAALAQT